MVAPSKAGAVNHVTNNETAKIMVTPGTVNLAIMNKTVKITSNVSICLACAVDTINNADRQIKTFG